MGRLWTPQQDMQDREPTMVCRVPTGPDELCLKEFYPGEERAFAKHVGECFEAHRVEVAATSPRRLAAFDEETWDPEAFLALRETGRRMLREGRLETLPSERVDG